MCRTYYLFFCTLPKFHLSPPITKNIFKKLMNSDYPHCWLYGCCRHGAGGAGGGLGVRAPVLDRHSVQGRHDVQSGRNGTGYHSDEKSAHPTWYCCRPQKTVCIPNSVLVKGLCSFLTSTKSASLLHWLLRPV